MLIRILIKINYKVEYILWKFNIGTSRTSKNNCIFFDIWSNLNNFITGLSLKKQWNVACSTILSFKKTSDEFVHQVYQGLFHTQDVVFWIAVVVSTWYLLKGKKKKTVLFLIIVSVAIFFSNAQVDLLSLSSIYSVEISKQIKIDY